MKSFLQITFALLSLKKLYSVKSESLPPAAFVPAAFNSGVRSRKPTLLKPLFVSTHVTEGEFSTAAEEEDGGHLGHHAKKAEIIRKQILDIIGSNLESGHQDPAVREDMASLLQTLRDECGGVAGNEALFEIAETVYGVELDVGSPPAPDIIGDSTVSSKPETEKRDGDKDDSVVIDFDFMKQFMKDVFESYGVPPDRAETCAGVLVEADKRGIHSHGLGRLKPIYCDRMDAGILHPSMPIDIVRETGATALLDGNLGLGLYIGPYAMQMAIDKAKKHGVGFVAVRNSTHYGIAGYYALMATNAGCVGWTGTNARPSIAPTFGIQPMLGTNPLCFGIPTDEDFPFVIDCATSINQRGKIEKYARDGVDTPRGAVIDNDGIERTDTEGILEDLVTGQCALNPIGGAGEDLGGYKGYGWATVVELLSIAFQSGLYGKDISGVDPETGKKTPMPLGHYFLAIDVEALCPLDAFKGNAGNLLRALRDSKTSPTGPGRIWTAGEPENDAFVSQTVQGGMKVQRPLQKVMRELRDNRPGLKEKYNRLPFE